MVEMAICNIQRAITPKLGNPELWFRYSAMIYIVKFHENIVKFHENISNGFQVTDWTREYGENGYIQYSKGNNSKSRKPRVMVHLFCTLSHDALHLCELL